MVANLTRQTSHDVEAFLAKVAPAAKQQDARTLCALLARISGEPPRMWGASMVGFGRYHYTYASGHEGDAMLIGFSPHKTALTIYIMDGFSSHQRLMARLGWYSTDKSCLHVKSLSDVDLEVLQALIAASVRNMRTKYGSG